MVKFWCGFALGVATGAGGLFFWIAWMLTDAR